MPATKRAQALKKNRRAAPTPELSEYQSYYAVIRNIPPGKVMTYGDVAGWAGRPQSARRVGYALFAVSDPTVPWWRVINARGEISLRQGSGPGGPEDQQRFLLAREGVELGPDGRVDMERCRYRPRVVPAKKVPKKVPPTAKKVPPTR